MRFICDSRLLVLEFTALQKSSAEIRRASLFNDPLHIVCRAGGLRAIGWLEFDLGSSFNALSYIIIKCHNRSSRVFMSLVITNERSIYFKNITLSHVFIVCRRHVDVPDAFFI